VPGQSGHLAPRPFGDAGVGSYQERNGEHRGRVVPSNGIWTGSMRGSDNAAAERKQAALRSNAMVIRGSAGLPCKKNPAIR
jgi:hypothetical protein